MIYRDSKQFFTAIAENLNIPTTNENDKPLSTEALKAEITLNVNPNTLFIFPHAKRIPTGIRYWLDFIGDQGVKIIAFTVTNPKKIFFSNYKN